MKEEIYNEKELKTLEDEIRALGIPYSQNEPDERYFTNFRVHLMERIDAKQNKGVFASIFSWLTTSPLRSFSLVGGLAVVIIAVLLMNPASAPQIAQFQPTQQMPVLTAPQQPTVQPEVKQNIAELPKKTVVASKAGVEKNTNLAAKITTDKKLDAAINANNFASMDETLTGNESDGPVNYENLSEADLESVVRIAQDMH